MGIIDGEFYFKDTEGKRFKNYKLENFTNFFDNKKDKLNSEDLIDALNLLDNFKLPFILKNNLLPLNNLTEILIKNKNSFNSNYLFLKLILYKNKELSILLTVKNNNLDVIVGFDVKEYKDINSVLINKLKFLFSSLANLIKVNPNILRITDSIPDDGVLQEDIFFNQLNSKLNPTIH